MEKRDRVLNVLGWLAFALACSAFFLPVINPDIFWHLSAGRYTLANFAPPRTDFLSWPLAGAEWLDFEWLSQVIYFLLYKAGGFKALLVFKALLLALTLLVFRAALLLYGRRAALPLALPFFAAAIVSNADVRPENFTLLFFALTLYGLERSRLRGLPAGTFFKAGVFAFFALWTNLHAGYLYGLALVGLYAAGEFFREELLFIRGRAPFARPAGSLEYLKLFFLGLAASLVNPYGWKIYSVIANHQRYLDTLQEYIQEWGAFSLSNHYQWPYALALAGVLGSFAWFVLRRRHAVYAHFACLLFFAWASADHARHIPFFILTGLVFALALPWGGLPAAGRGRSAALGAAALFMLVTCSFYGSFIWTQYTGKATGFKWGSEGLGLFLRENKAELSGLRLYNPWGWGGWLGWELGPDYKPFIDGRYIFHDRVREVVDARAGVRGWQELIGKYKFDLMLITLDDPQVPVKQSLPDGRVEMFYRPGYLFYLPRRDWAVVYWDASIAALARRAAVPAGWLAGREFRYLRPGDELNLVSPLLSGDVPLQAIKKELRLYLANRGAGREDPESLRLGRFVSELEKLCSKEGAKCAK